MWGWGRCIWCELEYYYTNYHSKQNTIHETLSCHMICTTCSRHTTTTFLQPTTQDDDDHDRRENYHVTNHGTNFPSFVGLMRALAPPSCYCTEKESSPSHFVWLGRNNPINPSMLLSHVTHYYMNFNITKALFSKAIDKTFWFTLLAMVERLSLSYLLIACYGEKT